MRVKWHDRRVPSIFRDPVRVTFVDADNNELAVIDQVEVLPRVGENVRLGAVPYIVERIGYDVPENRITRIWVVCQPV